MKHNNTELISMTYNGNDVMSWTHNGVEVFNSEIEIYNASLEYRTSFPEGIPCGISGEPYVNSKYITDVNALAYADTNKTFWGLTGTDIVNSSLGILSELALSRYKYIHIHYYYGAGVNKSSYDGQTAYCSICEQKLDEATVYKSPIITTGVKIITTQEFNSYTDHLYAQATNKRQGVHTYAGIGVTKIVLTNKEPT